MKKKVIAVIGFCGLMLSSHVNGMNKVYESGMPPPVSGVDNIPRGRYGPIRDITNGLIGLPGHIILKLLKIIDYNSSAIKELIGTCKELSLWKSHHGFQKGRYRIFIASLMKIIGHRYYRDLRKSNLSSDKVKLLYRLHYTEQHLNTGISHPKVVTRTNYLDVIGQLVSPIDAQTCPVSKFLMLLLFRGHQTTPEELYVMQIAIEDVNRLTPCDTKNLMMMVLHQRQRLVAWPRLLTHILERGKIETHEPITELMPILLAEHCENPTKVGPLKEFFLKVLWSDQGNFPTNRENIHSGGITAMLKQTPYNSGAGAARFYQATASNLAELVITLDTVIAGYPDFALATGTGVEMIFRKSQLNQ